MNDIEGSRDSRFPQQPVLYRDADYELTDADREAVAAGRAVWVSGFVLAKVEAICKEAGNLEVFFYYLAYLNERHVAVDLLLPRQRVSFGSCHVEPEEVLRCGREARKRGMVIVSAGHSHGHGSCFSSHIDRDQHSWLASESVGRRSTITTTSRGVIRPQPSRNASQERHERVYSFPGYHGLSVKLTTPGNLDPKAIDVEATHLKQQIRTEFSTSNNRGEHMFPAQLTTYCSTCTGRSKDMVPAREIEVYVHGRIEIGDDELEAIRSEVKEKVESYRYSHYGDDAYGYDYADDYACDERDQATGVARRGEQKLLPTEGRPSPYLLYRRGRRVAVIAPEVLEEAAAQNAALCTALGWKPPQTSDEPSYAK